MQKFFLLIFIIFVVSVNRTQAEEASVEAKLRAAFIYQFTHYVDWPADRLKNDGSHFSIAVSGDDILTDQLQELAKTKQVKGKSIEIVKWSENNPESRPFIIALMSKSIQVVENQLKSLKGCQCLTVTYLEGFGARGAIVNFFKEEDRLRFEINRSVALREKLEIHSQLLRLAKIVD